MKYIITESQHNKIIDKFITYQFEPHEVKKSSEYPDSIFWVKDGEVIVEIYKRRDDFWVRSEIWKVIRNMFSLEYSETQQVIRDWLEEHYKLGGLTPQMTEKRLWSLLEEHYKLGGLTPNRLTASDVESWKSIKLD